MARGKFAQKRLNAHNRLVEAAEVALASARKSRAKDRLEKISAAESALAKLKG